MALTRRLFLERLAATAGAAVTYEAMTALGLVAMPSTSADAFELRGQSPGTEVLILGAGLAGMSVAYELGKLGYTCTILEGRTRPGGRCYTVRGGTVSDEDGSSQTAAFDDGVYFNAGAMRIPHHHATVLGYLKAFDLPIEVFVDDNENAFAHKSAPSGPGRKFRRREVRSDVTGYTSEMLTKALSPAALNAPLTRADRDALIAYLRRNGALDGAGAYRGTTRRGYNAVPGAGNAAGDPSLPIPLHDLLDSGTALYLQTEYLHHAPMFQVAGGTDRLASAFAERLPGRIVYGANVREIRQTPSGVQVAYEVDGQVKQATADYGVCTLPLPVIASLPVADFAPAIKTGVSAVRYSQTGKIGLQFKRRFWEEDDQIFGGITNTDQAISNIVYPSAGYLGKKGLLIGYYQIGANAGDTGMKLPAAREAQALAEGGVIHPQYKTEFENSFSVAWHKVPWSRGGWAGWSAEDRKTTYQAMLKGDRRFYFAGDHMTYLIGWMNGALESGRSVAAALHARASQDVAKSAAVA
jgi:monoamine oxidase